MGKKHRDRHRRAATAAPASTAAATTRFWERAWFPAVVFALLTCLYFAEFLTSGNVIFGQDVGTDYHRGTEPVIEKIRELDQDLWQARMGGYPSSEEIRHRYFPTYLVYLFTTYQRHLGWRYLFIAFLAACGTYLYLRQLQIGRWAALWGGIAFMSAPTFLSFPFAGHYAKMTVISLFPLMLYTLERGMNEGRVWWFVWRLGGLIVLGIFTPHLQMLQYALLAIGLYFLFKLCVMFREGAPRAVLAGRAGMFALALALGFGVGVEGLIPPYLHVKSESKRAAVQDEMGRSPEEQLALARSWSLHPEEVVSLVVPEFGGFHDPVGERNYYWGRNPMKLNSEYFGVLVVLLALLLLPEIRRRPHALFMAGLFLLVLAFTLGGHTPVHWLAYHLIPGADVLRAVGMAAFLFAFPACVLAAMGLDACLKVRSASVPGQVSVYSRRLLTAGGALGALALLLALFPQAVVETWIAVANADISPDKRQILLDGLPWLRRGALCVFAVVAAATALLYLRLQGKIALVWTIAGLVVLTLFDTWRIDRRFLHYEDPSRYTDARQENPATVDFLRSPDNDPHRIFPVPDYGFLKIPGYRLHGLDLLHGTVVVTDHNNYTIRRYDRLLREFDPVLSQFSLKARGGDSPFSDDDLLGAIQPLLNLVNARYVVTPAPIRLQSERFPEVFARERVRVYENPQSLPWAYLVPSVTVLDNPITALHVLRDGTVDPRQTVILEREPPGAFGDRPVGDRAADQVQVTRRDPAAGVIEIAVASSGPRMLVVSDNYYPNWRACVDGEETELVRANYVWKAVYVPGGDHTVTLRYHSRAVNVSRTISLLCLLAVAAGGGWEWRRRVNRTNTDALNEESSAGDDDAGKV